jgi:putative MATE family efflux protein
MITLPIMIQNGITNFVGLLDNIMVGQVGTEPMSGVAIVNQLMLVFNICIFGAVAGAGILGAQFFGSQNYEGLRYAFRFKLVCSVVLSGVFMVVFLGGGEMLVGAFLHEGEGDGDLVATLGYGLDYLKVMLVGLLPFALTQAYSSTLRETGQTVVPMISGIAAVLINLLFNYILIFGKFGAPTLGVVGAAIATVLSRFVELAIIMVWSHKHTKENPFIEGLYRNFTIPSWLVAKIFRVGTPLFINELLWSVGMALLTQCYSLRGLEVVAAINIANTIGNLFNVVFISLGNAVGIIIGQLLGAGKLERAREEDNQLIAFAVFCCTISDIVMFLIAPLFPHLYNTDAAIQLLASRFIQICGLCMPIFAFVNTTYFTLRAGGKTIVTFLFDSAFMWVLTIPVVFILSRFTAMYIVAIYLICQLLDLIKCAIGFALVKRGVWLQNMVAEGGQE